MKIIRVASMHNWLRWIVRIVIYGVGVIIVLGLVLYITTSQLLSNVEKCKAEPNIRASQGKYGLKGMQDMVTCLERKNWFLENWLMHTAANTIRALPNAPCKYIGVWDSVRPQCRYKISLKENGEFTAEWIACNLSSKNYSGTWGVSQNQMVWLDNDAIVWPPDINFIEAEDQNSFSLVEVNGSHTKFTRIEDPSQAMGCAKPATQRPVEIAAVASAVAQSTNASSPVVMAEPIKPEKILAMLPTVTNESASTKKQILRAEKHKLSDLRYCLELASNFAIAKCANSKNVQRKK